MDRFSRILLKRIGDTIGEFHCKIKDDIIHIYRMEIVVRESILLYLDGMILEYNKNNILYMVDTIIQNIIVDPEYQRHQLVQLINSISE
jgi:mRNA-degrading endonuclease YafQ of YafQ-DinJ toxin-antitoxin module